MIGSLIVGLPTGLRAQDSNDGQRRQPRAGEARPRDDGGQKAVPRGEAQRAEPRTERERDQARDRARPPRADRAEPPRRVDVPPRAWSGPRTYYFPPIDVRLGFYYHPFFGFYYGPYYGPFYPYPGPFGRPTRYTASALRIRVKPVDTEVYLNGYYAGIVDDFDGILQRLYLPAGQHHLELRLEGYASFRRDVYIGPGDTLDIVHDMRPVPMGEHSGAPPAPGTLPPDWTAPDVGGAPDQPASPYGILALRIAPADAQILIDGEAWVASSDQHEFVVHLTSGWHDVEVRKTGYRPFATRLDLKEGQTTRLGVELQP
jgi:hypothetical protein